jgi:hypothetical protein
MLLSLGILSLQLPLQHSLVLLPPSNQAAAGPMASLLLPAGLQLPAAASAAAMDDHLAALMGQGLRPLLPHQQYCSLVKQLRVVFERHAHWQGLSAQQLQTLYVYVRAAVDDGRLGEVVSTLEDRLGRLAG